MNRTRPIALAGLCASLLLAAVAPLGCSSLAGGGSTGASESAAAAVPDGIRDANRLMVVDCLLPGQVRSIGSRFTYLTPRRPIKTTGVDCEIRGGEYVAFDRATYADSLKVWLPLAQEGDAKAQTYVGEIFEKGLGLAADYAAALDWYLRAAEQGYAPAQINLGQLYELGLGVPKDSSRALEWYRRASGLSDLDGEFVAFRGDAKKYQSLRAELDRTGSEAAALRKQVTSLHRDLAASRSRRDDTKATIANESAELEQLRAELDRRASELETRDAALRRERSELERALRSAPDAGALAQREQELAARATELEGQSRELAQQQERAAARQRELDDRGRELAAMDERIQKLAADAERERLEFKQRIATQVETVVEGPRIVMIDPSVPLTRSATAPSVVVGGKERSLVGRVEAPAGLVSLLVNDVEAKADAEGFFETRVRVRSIATEVNIVAIDQQGKRATRSFMVRRGSAGDAAPPAKGAPVAIRTAAGGVDFGRYYALVIGNAAYQHMPRLETAHADARGVAQLLESRYGFDVKLVLDADRYELLAALNEMRGKLTENDNFLLYYAGHGEFDEKEQTGYWLPVDARPENDLNWVANRAITDILNATDARHVMVVADSCYSGSLTESSIPRVEGADSDTGAGELLRFQSKLHERSSRTALTSGGLSPVLDGGGGAHSLFARAFIDILGGNDDVLDGSRLHSELAARVRYKARSRAFRQEPEYAPIRYGRHGGGEFFFVPRG